MFRKLSAERCETLFNQGLRVARVVDTEALVFVCDVDPVPKGSGFCFWNEVDGRVTFVIEPALGD